MKLWTFSETLGRCKFYQTAIKHYNLKDISFIYISTDASQMNDSVFL